LREILGSAHVGALGLPFLHFTWVRATSRLASSHGRVSYDTNPCGLWLFYLWSGVDSAADRVPSFFFMGFQSAFDRPEEILPTSSFFVSTRSKFHFPSSFFFPSFGAQRSWQWDPLFPFFFLPFPKSGKVTFNPDEKPSRPPLSRGRHRPPFSGQQIPPFFLPGDRTGEPEPLRPMRQFFLRVSTQRKFPLSSSFGLDRPRLTRRPLSFSRSG